MNPSIKLSEPSTGYRHAKCYANADDNCSTKISKEHFISAALLRRLQLNNKAKIAGLAWQKQETFDLVPLKGLASNILCERHNSALSGLDRGIDALTQAIRGFDKSTRSQTTSFSGSDIERWMLKCLIGMTVLCNIRSKLKPECIDLLFGRLAWPDGWGLYFSNAGADPVFHTDSLLIKTRVNPANNLILAADFFIQGLPFMLVMGKPDNPSGFGIWRPNALVFQHPSVSQTLELLWDDPSSGMFVRLTRIGRYDGHPPHWKDWEKNG